MKTTLRNGAKRILVLFFSAIFLIGCTSCGRQYKGTFKDNDYAANMMEEAIYTLQLCLDGKIGVDEVGQELATIANKYESVIGGDSMAEVYRLGISIDASLLEFWGVYWRNGEESTASMMKRVEKIKAELEEDLYK